MHTAGSQTCTACPENSTTTSTAITEIYECMCNAGYMDSSAYTICSSAKPCQSGFFCTSEYGGGEGLCLSCGVVPTVAGARCCSAVSPFFNWGNGEPWAKDGFLSKDNVQKCYAACGGTEPGMPGSNCTAATYDSGSGSGSGSGSTYYSTPSPSLSSPSRQGSVACVLILLNMCRHTEYSYSWQVSHKSHRSCCIGAWRMQNQFMI